MLIVDYPQIIEASEQSARSEPESPVVFHARHLVRLVARSRMMILDLGQRDRTLLSADLIRIMVISDEAGLGEIQKATGQLLAELPDLSEVEIYRRTIQLHGRIMASYHDSRRCVRAPAHH